ncbi:MAG: AbrB/MazE/SpoVT family DNA-binding domain-containing protein [Verrucomicrobia bacterium]|nr:MAG: AbrB/MazE/SpoVT family DNA-binding domain-containing protein [Verrucomicrobiota bacterium]
MITKVTSKNTVTIPAAIARKLGIKPGSRLDWQVPEDGSDEIRVRVVPSRAELARELMGRWKHLAPGRDVIAELDEERVREDEERMKDLLGES